MLYKPFYNDRSFKFLELDEGNFPRTLITMEECEWNDPIPGLPGLTHRGWVTHIYISKLIHHRIRQWLAICLEQSHYQSWRVIYWTIRSKFRWYLNRKTKFSMHENAYKTPSAKWRLFCLGFNILTHPLLDKMAAIQQTTISKSFSWMESFFYFDSNFTEICSQWPNW